MQASFRLLHFRYKEPLLQSGSGRRRKALTQRADWWILY